MRPTAIQDFGGLKRQLTAVTVPDVKIGKFPPIEVFEGRRRQLDTLVEAATGTQVSVAGFDEIGGQGKTMLGLRFIQELKDRGRSEFEGYFSFTFYGDQSDNDKAPLHDVEAVKKAVNKEAVFEESLTRFLVEQLGEPKRGPQDDPADWLAGVLRRRAVFLFLDGMELIQTEGGSETGTMQKSAITWKLLSRLCRPGRRPRSFALLTSRFPFRDFDRYLGRFLKVELDGLLPTEGADALEKWEVDAPRPALEAYARDLAGHPLSLLAFARSVNRTAMTLPGELSQPGAAAAYVAQQAALAEPGTPASKVARMLSYYRHVLTEAERAVLEIIALEPNGIRDSWLRQLSRNRLPGLARKDIGGALENALSSPALKGILQSSHDRGHKIYNCHPIIRQTFRPRESHLVAPLAELHITNRPPQFIPKTIAQIKPYLNKITTLTENEMFAQAAHTLVQSLDSGERLVQLGASRELFDCLNEFFHPDRREAALAQLGTGWFNAMLPRMVDCCIALNEWKLAEE